MTSSLPKTKRSKFENLYIDLTQDEKEYDYEDFVFVQRQKKMSKMVITDLKRDAFLEACRDHLKYFEYSHVCDAWLLAIAFIYLERAQVPVERYAENLFLAIWVAIAMEEDSVRGLDEMIVYLIGLSTVQKNFAYVTMHDMSWRYKEETHWIWEMQYHDFITAKDTFLSKALDFSTLVPRETCERVMTAFEKRFDTLFSNQREQREGWTVPTCEE